MKRRRRRNNLGPRRPFYEAPVDWWLAARRWEAEARLRDRWAPVSRPMTPDEAAHRREGRMLPDINHGHPAWLRMPIGRHREDREGPGDTRGDTK